MSLPILVVDSRRHPEPSLNSMAGTGGGPVGARSRIESNLPPARMRPVPLSVSSVSR